MKRVMAHYPMAVAVIALWGAVLLIAGRSMAILHGHLGYELDDAYIHMAIARNIAEHGVWGVTRYEFTPVSSSLIWPIVLASVYWIFGAIESVPLALNLIFATAAIGIAHGLLRRYGVSGLPETVVLLMLVFFAPLPSVVLCGLEHTLHLALSIAFIAGAARLLAGHETIAAPRLSGSLALLLLAPVLVMSRFEAAFLVCAACVLFAIRRRFAYAMALGGIGILPVVVFGLISVGKGWFFVPNSVLMKANRPRSFDAAGLTSYVLGFSFQDVAGLRVIVRHPELWAVTLGAVSLFLLMYLRRRTLWQDGVVMLALYLATLFLHLQFARVGPYYRYEAYLVALGILLGAVGIRDCWRAEPPGWGPWHARAFATVSVVAVLMTWPLVERGVKSFEFAGQAMTNIYEQQYQMGLFLKESYAGRAVAANDIGAINFLADIRTLDLWGLGTIEVARAKQQKTYGSKVMDGLARARGIDIAVVSESWFKDYGGIPREWTRVGTWTIRNNVVCADATVTFFAVRTEEAGPLAERLKAFGDRLPTDVIREVRY